METHAPKAVFLSYASQDADAARRIAQALRTEGVEVWFDQSELRGGDAWDASIRRQIRDCALFVAVVSANTQARKEGYFRLEWKLADERSHLIAEGTPFVLPVIVDGTKERDALVPKSFLGVQWTWLPHGEVPPAFVTRVQRLLNPGEAGSTTTAPAFVAEATITTSPTITAPPAQAETSESSAAPTRRIPRTAFVFSAGVVVTLLAVAFVVAVRDGGFGSLTGHGRFKGRPSSELPTSRLEIGPPHRTFGFQPAPSISTDGRQIAFWAPDEADKIGLWVRSLDSPTARLLAGTYTPHEMCSAACWSPDGQSLAYFADGKLKRIDVAGGTPMTLADAANPRGVSWSKDGVIIFVPATGQPVHRIPASGGQATALTVGSPEECEGYAWPHFLPNGRQFFVTANQKGPAHILVASLDGKESRMISKLESRFEYAGGHVFFGRQSSLFAQRFDEQTLTLSGEPFRVTDNLGLTFGDLNAYTFSVSRQGTLVVWGGRINAVTQLTWFSRSGQRLGTLGEPGEYLGFAAAPGFQHAVLERHDPKGNEVDLWLVDATSNVGSKFSSGVGDYRPWAVCTPVWSPEGDRVLFGTVPGVVVQPLRGGEPEKLFDGIGWLCDITPDGQTALFGNVHPETGGDLWTLPLKGDRTLKPFLVAKPNELAGRFSPDGRWVAYLSEDSGKFDVYVQSYPRPGRATRISRDGVAAPPEWRSDGKELYYLTLDQRLMAASLDVRDPLVQVTATQALFSVKTGSDFGRRQYQATSDGEKFLINAVVEDTSLRLFSVILNWKPPAKN